MKEDRFEVITAVSMKMTINSLLSSISVEFGFETTCGVQVAEFDETGPVFLHDLAI
jgi:hypothetical protein